MSILNKKMNPFGFSESKNTTNMDALEKFLEDEIKSNCSEPWCKLDKTTKYKKLLVYANEYKTKNNLNEEQYAILVAYFKDCLDKKRLQKVKDVIYDKENGVIKDIPILVFNKSNNNFTLKNIEKKTTTLKTSISKPIRGTAKNKNNDDDSE
jgi:hypothetical protein